MKEHELIYVDCKQYRTVGINELNGISDGSQYITLNEHFYIQNSPLKIK